jgi:hypothetical protein
VEKVEKVEKKIAGQARNDDTRGLLRRKTPRNEGTRALLCKALCAEE